MDKRRIVKVLFVLLVLSSIALTYYVIMVQKDYEIVTNPDGPDTSDYLE